MNNFNRKSAFSIEVIDPDTGKPPEGQSRLIQLENSMHAFFGDGIYECHTPESIDPENKAPDTRPAYQKIHSIGLRNSWIARSIIQADEMMKSVHLRQGLSKKALLDRVWSCTKLLLKCEKAHYEIYTQTMEKMHQCDQIIQENKTSGYIPSLPQIDGLEDKVLSFFNYAKKFLIETHALISDFFNAPQVGGDFHKLNKWLVKNLAEEKYLLPMLESDGDWIKIVRECRNAIEHPKDHYKVEITNFKLHPGNKYSMPSWRYDLSSANGPVQPHFSDMIVDFNVYMENFLTFIEEVFILCLKSNWDQKFPFEIYKNTPEQIRKECPTLYYVNMKNFAAVRPTGEAPIKPTEN